MTDGDLAVDEIEEENPAPEELGNFNFLGVVKTLLGIKDDELDSILSIYIDITRNSILNYCNITELPPALDYTLCQLVVDTYLEGKNKTTVGEVVGGISSISEDGRSVSFMSGTEYQASIDDRIPKTKELNRFKKLYRL